MALQPQHGGFEDEDIQFDGAELFGSTDEEALLPMALQPQHEGFEDEDIQLDEAELFGSPNEEEDI